MRPAGLTNLASNPLEHVVQDESISVMGNSQGLGRLMTTGPGDAIGLRNERPRIRPCLVSVATDGESIQLVEAQDLQGGNACDEPYNPYSQVVILDRDQVPNQDALPVDGDLTFAILTDGTPLSGTDQTLRAVVTTFDE